MSVVTVVSSHRYNCPARQGVTLYGDEQTVVRLLKSLTQGPTVRKWQGWDLNPALSGSRAHSLSSLRAEHP